MLVSWTFPSIYQYQMFLKSIRRIGKETDSNTGGYADRQQDGRTETQTERKAEKQTDRKEDRETGTYSLHKFFFIWHLRPQDLPETVGFSPFYHHVVTVHPLRMYQ